MSYAPMSKRMAGLTLRLRIGRRVYVLMLDVDTFTSNQIERQTK